MGAEELLEISLKMLRFSLESHIEGNYACLDGTKWGHTWISSLGLERMMHSVDAIKKHLTDSDNLLLKKVMISESDWLLDKYYRHHPEEKGIIKAGKLENNHPESNIWNGAHLLRTAMMYPESERAGEYLRKATAFIVNGLSIPSDENCEEIIDGKPVAEWFIGPNFFESFALNHHGYLNVGYMVVCLSNLAMLHFSYRLAGLPAPEFIYRHVESLWNLVKTCTFPDGRLCRIGGDTRIRYCNCQDYAIPAWLMIYDLFGDNDCAKFEKNWLDIIRKELSANGDGSFLSERCKSIEDVSPLYYTRIESDRAAVLSMGAYWRKNLRIPSAGKGPVKAVKQFWRDEYHGAVLHKGRNRMASFCWVAAQFPQGLCVPADRSDMAEWRYNCAGMLTGLGRDNYHKIMEHRENLFKGGFITSGQTEVNSGGFMEGQKDGIPSRHNIVFAALPDDATVLVMQKCVASERLYLKEIKGFLYNVPNDIFNDGIRSYYWEKGCYESKGCRGKEEAVDINSVWMNVDNCLGIIGVYGSNHFTVYRPGMRQAGLMLSQYEGRVIEAGLWVDEICYPYKKGVLSVNRGAVLLDIGCVIVAGQSSGDTALQAEREAYAPAVKGSRDVRAIMVKGADAQWYLLAANFSTARTEVTVILEDVCNARSLTMENCPEAGPHGMNIVMEGGRADVFRLDCRRRKDNGKKKIA